MRKAKTTLAAAALALVSLTGTAEIIQCGSIDKFASLGGALVCETGVGNTTGNGETINGHFYYLLLRKVTRIALQTCSYYCFNNK